MRFKHEFYYHPNYEFLRHITSRKDSVAVRAWNDLYNLFMSGKESLFDFQTRRSKKWRTKMLKAGFIYKNPYSGSYRLTSKALELFFGIK